MAQQQPTSKVVLATSDDASMYDNMDGFGDEAAAVKSDNGSVHSLNATAMATATGDVAGEVPRTAAGQPTELAVSAGVARGSVDPPSATYKQPPGAGVGGNANAKALTQNRGSMVQQQQQHRAPSPSPRKVTLAGASTTTEDDRDAVSLDGFGDETAAVKSGDGRHNLNNVNVLTRGVRVAPCHATDSHHTLTPPHSVSHPAMPHCCLYSTTRCLLCSKSGAMVWVVR